jgi:hypothetical protein
LSRATIGCGVEARQGRLGDGRHFRQRRAALGSGYCKRAQPAGANERQRRRYGAELHLDTTLDDVEHGLGGGTIGYLIKLHAGSHREQHGCEKAHARRAEGGIVEAARF